MPKSKPADIFQQHESIISQLNENMRACACPNKSSSEQQKDWEAVEEKCIEHLRVYLDILKSYFGDSARRNSEKVNLKFLYNLWTCYRTIISSMNPPKSIAPELRDTVLARLGDFVINSKFNTDIYFFKLLGEFSFDELGANRFHEYCQVLINPKSTMLNTTDDEKDSPTLGITSFSELEKAAYRIAVINKDKFFEYVKKNYINDKGNLETLTDEISEITKLFRSEQNNDEISVSTCSHVIFKVLTCSREGTFPSWEVKTNCGTFQQLQKILSPNQHSGSFLGLFNGWTRTPTGSDASSNTPPSPDSSPAASAATSPPSPALSAQSGSGSSSG
jgi:hypothetical protein